jgi:hypothetical protein
MILAGEFRSCLIHGRLVVSERRRLELLLGFGFFALLVLWSVKFCLDSLQFGL